MERNYHVYLYSELADIHLMYWMGRCNNSAVRRLYHEKYPNRICPSPRFLTTIHQRLSETGYLQSKEDTNAGRTRSIRTIDLEELVLSEISEHPEKSTRELSLQFNSNQYIIGRLLHEQQLHPYHVQQLLTLLPRDYALRVVICQSFLDKCIDPNSLSKVLFTNEAHFARTAIVNVHN
ncbi:UNVERIFIED_CONTAM: hypothetical protein RMT77_016612 [Armadillidium vulgare]